MTRRSDTLLSVAIPTKNRTAYLKNLIEELLTSDRQDFEIVIQDNSDDDGLSDWIVELADARVRYSYHAGWISVVDNCDMALRACRGEYVCMLGDDDGIMLDESLSVLTDAKRDGIDAVMSRVLNYVWPDLDHHLIQDYGGKLYMQPIKGKDSSNDLETTARGVVRRGGATGLQDLPCVYHGFISNRALSALYEQTGSYFPGPSPDMANAIGLCAVLGTLRRTPEVLVITGHSVCSTAGAGTQRKHHGPVAGQSHLPRDTVETWFADIPFFWSGPTIYAQSLRSALSRTGNTKFGPAGKSCVYASCFVYHREYADATFDAMRVSTQSKLTLYPQVLYYSLEIMAQRARNLLSKLSGRIGNRKNAAVRASSISEAIRAVRTLRNMA